MTSDYVSTAVAGPAPATPDVVPAVGWRDRLSVRLATPLLGGLAVLAVLVATVGSNAYVAGIVIETLFWITAASAWNVLGGYTGMLSLGHALFIGLSMYGVTFAVNHGWSWWAATPLVVVATTVIGTLVLYPGFRLRGPFFSLATFALPLIATTLAVYAKGLTGGSQGQTWPYNTSTGQFVFTSRIPYLLVIGAIALAAVLVSVLIDRRAIGRRMARSPTMTWPPRPRVSQ